MHKPTPEQVKFYALSINFPELDPGQFCDYYQSIGWVVGPRRKPMVDWQAAVRTWKRKYDQEQKEKAAAQASPPTRPKPVPPSVLYAPPPESELLTWEDIQKAKRGELK